MRTLASSAAGMISRSFVSAKSGESLTMSGLSVARRTSLSKVASSPGLRLPLVDQPGVGEEI